MSIITSFPSPAGPQVRLSPLGLIQPLAALQQSAQELPALALRAVETGAAIRPAVKEFVAPKPAALPPNEIDGVTLDHIPYQFDDAILIDDLPRPEPAPAPTPTPTPTPTPKQAETPQPEARSSPTNQPDASQKLLQTAERGYLASRDAQRTEEPVEIKLPSDQTIAKPSAEAAEEAPESLVKKLAEKLQPVEE